MSPRSVDHLPSQKSDSELSSLVDEPSKKKARGKSKVNPLIPLCHALTLPFVNIQNSETGKSLVKSKRPKQSSHTLSKEDETIKRLKVPVFCFGIYTRLLLTQFPQSLVVACGVRKQWTRELDGLNTGAQIAHIRKILSDLGMVGRLSMEQAREIRAQRELAQELGAWSLPSTPRGHKVIDLSRFPDDVQKFERAVVSGKPFKTGGTSKRLSKSGSGNADNANANDSSSSESEDASADPEPPKMVSRSLILGQSILILSE